MRLEIDRLNFSYGTRQVLEDISLTVDSGEFVALLGPNGVGKSTLFRCILGLIAPGSGAVYLGGQAVSDMGREAAARCVAYIPQSNYPVFNHTVLEVVLMGVSSRLGRRMTPGPGHTREAREALESLGIGHLEKRGFRQISGGERQMVLLARALVQKAQLLVMDEPAANLDFGNGHRVMEKVRGLAAEGYSVLLSTHDPSHAFLYAGRAVVLLDGRILCDGKPGAVLTESVISRAYGIEVDMVEVMAGGGQVSVCLPRRAK